MENFLFILNNKNPLLDGTLKWVLRLFIPFFRKLGNPLIEQ